MKHKEALSSQQSEAAFGNQHSAVSQNQQQQQNQNRGPGSPELQRAEELVGKLGETYDELIRLMDQNPGVARQVTGTKANHEKIDRKLKARLELADAMPRCRWIKQGGTTCGSPQMKQHIYCFAHIQMAEAQALALRLPPPEDANAIQVGLMRIQKALIEDTITTRKAGLLLYSMQLALTNVGQTTFGQAKDEDLVLETVDAEEAISEKALSSQPSAFSGRQNQHQNQRPFTAKDAEDATENGERQNQQQNQRPFTAKDAEDAKENGERQNQQQNQNLFTTEDAENAEGSSERQNQNQSQNQDQNQHQRPFTAEDAKNAEGSSERQNQHQNQNQDQNQTPFTAEDAKNATENQGLPIRTDDTDRKSLPQMHADRRGVQQRTKQIEWKPSPDMYRMDTREGREAYEASLRVKIEPRPCAEGRPPQPGIVPDDRETHAVLG